MYIKEITKDFLIKGMLEKAFSDCDEPEIDMVKEVENELLNLIDQIQAEKNRDEDREGELQEYKNTLAEVREYPEDNDAALPKEKIGTIEEAFFTIKKEPCYWVVGEKELVMGDQIIGLA